MSKYLRKARLPAQRGRAQRRRPDSWPGVSAQAVALDLELLCHLSEPWLGKVVGPQVGSALTVWRSSPWPAPHCPPGKGSRHWAKGLQKQVSEWYTPQPE